MRSSSRAVLILLFSAAGIFLGRSLARAQAPNLLTYQGRLKEAGTPANGARTVEIFLCDALSGGTCHSTFPGGQGVSVVSGLFRTTFTVPSGVDLTQGAWYLDVWVSGNELLPREQLSSSPYAFIALSASSAATLTPMAGQNGAAVATNLYVVGATMSVVGQDGEGFSLSLSSGLFMPEGTVKAGMFLGDGAGLANVKAAGAVSKTGDAMSGPLTITGSSLTVVDTSITDAYVFAASTSADAGAYSLLVATTGAVQFAGPLQRMGSATLGPYAVTQVNLGTLSRTDGTAFGYSTVGGGIQNYADSDYSTVAGGYGSTAGGFYAAIGGGESNTTSNQRATIAGGSSNDVTGQWGTVAGGFHNRVYNGYGAVGGGALNIASGLYSVVPGGAGNKAQGDFSFAAGFGATTTANGSFVWSDSQGGFSRNVQDEFAVRSQGGFWVDSSSVTFVNNGFPRFYIHADGTMGIGAPPGGLNKLDVYGTMSVGNVVLGNAGLGVPAYALDFRSGSPAYINFQDGGGIKGGGDVNIEPAGKVIIGSTLNVTGAMHVGGPVSLNSISVNGDRTIAADESVGIIFADATGGNVTITLPPASVDTIGRMYRIYKVDASGNSVNVAGAGGSSNEIFGSTTTATPGCVLEVVGQTASQWVSPAFNCAVGAISVPF